MKWGTMATKRIGITIDESIYIMARVEHKNFSRYVQNLMIADMLEEYKRDLQVATMKGYEPPQQAQIRNAGIESDFERAKRIASI